MEDFVRSSLLFGSQHKESTTSHGVNKALEIVRGKVGRFDGENISRFLKTYSCKMEMYYVLEAWLIVTFDLGIVAKICERVIELHDEMHVSTVPRFVRRLKEK